MQSILLFAVFYWLALLFSDLVWFLWITSLCLEDTAQTKRARELSLIIQWFFAENWIFPVSCLPHRDFGSALRRFSFSGLFDAMCEKSRKMSCNRLVAECESESQAVRARPYGILMGRLRIPDLGATGTPCAKRKSWDEWIGPGPRKHLHCVGDGKGKERS
ncbi:unnamed protein product [Arctogadus glacialis]